LVVIHSSLTANIYATCFGLIDRLEVYKLVLDGGSCKATANATAFRLELHRSHSRVVLPLVSYIKVLIVISILI
jgi:hypothetical protein